jgi:hypothetical protein
LACTPTHTSTHQHIPFISSKKMTASMSLSVSTVAALMAAVVLSMLCVATADSSAGSSSSSGNYYAVRQSASLNGYFEMYSRSDASLVATSTMDAFTFRWPLVEVASDSVNKQFFLTAYPNEYAGPILVQLDEELTVQHVWNSSNVSYFDFQYSTVLSQRYSTNVLFGIKVISSYGRALSKFVVDAKSDTIDITEVFTLPYMWYVNASTFDGPNCKYFALINNFPGQTNSTYDQQLMVGEFADVDKPVVTLYNVSNFGGQIQFISYSQNLSLLFGTGINLQTNTAIVSLISANSGNVGQAYVNLFKESNVTEVGPLVVEPLQLNGQKSIADYQLILHVKRGANRWDILSLAFSSRFRLVIGAPTVLRSFSGSEYSYFVAGLPGF